VAKLPKELVCFCFIKKQIFFSFSRFTTYSRQDQGEEILYYPEPKSFPLPYEMPASTFYPRKDGPGGRGDKFKRKFLLTEPSSTMDSLAASGTATPTEEESSTAANEDDPWTRTPPPPPPPQAKPLRGRRGRPADAEQLANALKRTKESEAAGKFGPKVSLALREFSRKSPRGHASTRFVLFVTKRPSLGTYTGIGRTGRLFKNFAPSFKVPKRKVL
jgi:hypothetical protein